MGTISFSALCCVTEVSSGGGVSDAEFWLQTTATAVSSTSAVVDPFPAPHTAAATTSARMNGQHPAPPLPTPMVNKGGV